MIGRVGVYIMLFIVIFCTLLFITVQNRNYREIVVLEGNIYQWINREVASYQENLYKIEDLKSQSIDMPLIHNLEIIDLANLGDEKSE